MILANTAIDVSRKEINEIIEEEFFLGQCLIDLSVLFFDPASVSPFGGHRLSFENF